MISKYKLPKLEIIQTRLKSFLKKCIGELLNYEKDVCLRSDSSNINFFITD